MVELETLSLAEMRSASQGPLPEMLIRGGFPDPVTATTDKAIIVSGQLELVGGGGGSESAINPAQAQGAGYMVVKNRGELEALGGDEGAKSVLAAHAAVLVKIPVGDPGVIRDIDRPEDLAPPARV